MKQVTVFSISDKNFPLNEDAQAVTVEATGQEAATAIFNKYPKDRIILLGFIIDGVFKAVNLN